MNMPQQSQGAQLREVKLPLFSGHQGDVMEFSDFFGLFEDLVGKYSGASKLLYLKVYLRGSALDLIKHLSNNDENYNLAIDFLKKEYLDKDVLVETHIHRLCELKRLPPADLAAIQNFMNTARTYVYELKALGYDALCDDDLGSRIISFLLCEKLPTEFKIKTKLSFTIGSDTPTAKQLLEHYSDVIRSLEKMAPLKQSTKPSFEPSKDTSTKGQRNPPAPKLKMAAQKPQYSPKSISTFQTDTQKETQKFKPCKLCQAAHSMLKCTAYKDATSRSARLAELKLCTACSGQHSTFNCPGKGKGLNYPCTICGDKSHISALCTSGQTTQNRLCLTSKQNGGQGLLPTTSVVISACGEAEVARALIDHGSQASYISEHLAQKLKLEGKGREETFTVKTCIGTEEKVHRVVTCEIAINPRCMIKAEFLVDETMDLSYKLPGVSQTVKQLQADGITLADCFFRHQDTDDIDNMHCLLGGSTSCQISPLFKQWPWVKAQLTRWTKGSSSLEI